MIANAYQQSMKVFDHLKYRKTLCIVFFLSYLSNMPQASCKRFCQAVCNKIRFTADELPNELKDLTYLEIILTSVRIFFKKIIIRHGKEEFSKN